MSDEMNVEWMDEYELTYQKYRKQWNSHYQKVRNFILSSIHDDITNWGFIGVTNTIPEIDERILKKVNKLTLLDINVKSMKFAKNHVIEKNGFSNINLIHFDNTSGFTDSIVDIFKKFEINEISKNEMFEKLKNIESPKIDEQPQFDFITHLGLMDYYLMPIFNKYCSHFEEENEEFFQILRKLNHEATKISLQVLYQILEHNGTLIISSPVTRIPEGDKCNRSLFWLESLEDNIEDTGFQIVEQIKHIWEEFPTSTGHSHEILNVKCTKNKDEV